MEIVQVERGHEIIREVEVYNLDAALIRGVTIRMGSGALLRG